MNRFRLILVGALFAIAACASPVPTTTSTPSASAAGVATPTPAATPPVPSPSGTPSPSVESVTCLPETHPLPSGLEGDPCPSAIAAVRSIVASLGLSIARLYLEPGPFDCGDLWPGVGSPVVCFGVLVIPGTSMHGWVTFVGTDRVAAVDVHRPYPDATPSASRRWTAYLRAFVVPPAGWALP